MSTRPIVPRADGEGSLGTAAKKWGAVYTALINALTLTSQVVGFTIAGGTTAKTLTVDETISLTDKMNKTGGNLAIGSDADGDIYYRASGILARLAKGAANTKLYMNAAATAPIWGVGTVTLNAIRAFDGATASVSYTGAGFKPSMAIFLCAYEGMAHAWSVGVATLSGGSLLYDYNTVVANSKRVLGTFYGYVSVVLNTDATGQMAIFSSFDTDGCTLSWTRVGSSVGGSLAMSIIFIR